MLLSGVADLDREMRMLRSGDVGEVAVGVGPFTGLTLLPAAVARLYAKHPSVRVTLVEDNWRVLIDVLQQGKLDFMLAHITEIRPDASLEVEPLGGLPGHFYCRPTHPLARRRELSARELAGQRFASVGIPQDFKTGLDALIAAPDGNGFNVTLDPRTPACWCKWRSDPTSCCLRGTPFSPMSSRPASWSGST